MTVPSHFSSVPLEKAYRLLNHGPTVLVSSAFGGEINIMAAAWSCALDFTPPKVTVVIDKAIRTRALVEASGQFVLSLPCKTIAALTLALGTQSAVQAPDKLQRLGAEVFFAPESDSPLVHGCVGWLVCKVVPEPHNQSAYDLFIGEVTHAYADSRVFRNGHWEFDDQPDDLRTLHYVAGGQFYLTGASLKISAGETS